MKRLLAVPLLVTLSVFVPALAADTGAPKAGGKILVEGTKVVELADGGTISLGKDGTTYHVDAKGKRVRMKDGVVMQGKDGAKYLHKNDAIWKQITEKGTLAPNR
ncbi:MAG TPA: CopK family periplasmic copper-binding protein [Usitatibacter sp.]|nr:CopK family periplasmic copper-binding protein [Usitatibacter sp.]